MVDLKRMSKGYSYPIGLICCLGRNDSPKIKVVREGDVPKVLQE